MDPELQRGREREGDRRGKIERVEREREKESGRVSQRERKGKRRREGGEWGERDKKRDIIHVWSTT